ncbi:hypothetical protein GCM10010329_67790 [Streptomyces spiroverticillatus]|uniref:Uncharacterized protein n=1 Tax=Streptomyces finlayi TaxID=67296 RepID=A0A918X5U0_9ACTN|nr:hypothetical protein [Streptomyces finlayi]GHA35087.1 hypothetical protein GCM10010329_67790 [Streptomyces spiroverticillatus]GHD13084.1 hypothetical protein GCM10010334_70880 [Streptomyces finlayi]
MTHAFYSDAAEKARLDLSPRERAAVEDVRLSLESAPGRGESVPDSGPGSSSYVVELLPEETGGRGISVLYRYDGALDAALITYLVAGP